MTFVFQYKLTRDEQIHQSNKLKYKIYLLKEHGYNLLNKLLQREQTHILIKISFHPHQCIIQNE